jgi:hypothetical protein
VLRKVSSGTFICEGEFATSSIHNYSAFSDKFTKIVFFTFDDYYKVVKENGESLEKFAMLKENLMFNENFKFSGHICDICHWTHHYLVYHHHNYLGALSLSSSLTKDAFTTISRRSNASLGVNSRSATAIKSRVILCYETPRSACWPTS